MSGCRVFVGRLSPHARERDVEKFFKGYGRIREINLKNGFGFVEFEDHRDADDAVYELNGKELCNERVTIEHARARRGGRGRYPQRFNYYQSYGGGSSQYGPPLRTEHRLIVENLSSRVSWQDLKDFMRKAGEVTFVDAHRNNPNEGVVEFASSSDMKSALDKLDGSELNGRRIKLIEDRKRRRSAPSSSIKSWMKDDVFWTDLAFNSSSTKPEGKDEWFLLLMLSFLQEASAKMKWDPLDRCVGELNCSILTRSRSRSRSYSRSRSKSRSARSSKSSSRSRSRSRTPEKRSSRSRTPERKGSEKNHHPGTHNSSPSPPPPKKRSRSRSSSAESRS
ncbi:Serine/arginine-rich splicing factor 4 [Varanus komodoensis]|nr:Serine/arginine-rich splicing factor 4 [Varanus komodoensis]